MRHQHASLVETVQAGAVFVREVLQNETDMGRKTRQERILNEWGSATVRLERDFNSFVCISVITCD